MTSASWRNARMCRMRAAETRALADEMKEPEPKAIMEGPLSIMIDWPNRPKKFNILVG